MTQLTSQAPSQGLNKDGRRRLGQVAFTYILYALLLFIPAGSLRWWNAWVYLGMSVLAILTVGLYVMRKNPGAINERGRSSKKTKPFDKVFGVLTLPLHLGSLVVAGLDFRFGWSIVPLWAQIAGFLGLVPGFLMPYWVMLVNTYAATTVRVETERGQHVITTGPYRYVRHPFYTSVILGYVFAPLAFGSWWMAVPSALLIALFVWRTANEDQTLQEELPGYREYTRQTRYRLVPGIW